MVKISLLILMFNAEEYIEKCLSSIVNQKFKEWELIIINDGSTDGSKEIVESFSDERIFLYEQENQGIAFSRSRALALAKGDYFLYIDSDDWLEDGALEKIYGYASSNCLDLLYFNYFKFKNGISIPKYESCGIDGEKCVLSILYQKMGGVLWNKLIKRKFVLNNKISFLNDVNMWEDFYFTVQCFFYAKKIGYIDQYLYFYRDSNGSFVKRFDEKRIENQLKVIKELRFFFEKHGCYSNYEDALFYSKNYALLSLCQSDVNIRRRYYDYLSLDCMRIYRCQIVWRKKIILLLLNLRMFKLVNFISLVLKLIRKNEY